MLDRRMVLAGTLAAAIGSACGAAAQTKDYPVRPVTVIVPYGPGGGVGINARALAPHLAKVLGQEVVVEHREGGGGVTGHTMGAFAKPDGYTLTMVSPGIAAAPWLVPGVRFTPEDYDYIGQVTFVPNFIVVHADSPYKTVQDLVAAMKGRPGEIAGAMITGWPSAVVAQAVFLDKAGAKAKLVPGFKSGAEMLAAVLGKHLDYAFINLNEALPQYEAKKIRVLAASAPQRAPLMPDVPTFRELGYDVNIGVWRTLAAPKGTPKEIVATLSAALRKALDSPELKADFDKLGLSIDFLDPAATRALVMQEHQDLGALFTAMGMNVQKAGAKN